jgi:putative transposase
VYRQVAEAAEGGGVVKQLCATVEVSRAGYYRRLRTPSQPAESMALRDELQKLALQWPTYGYRRITRELQRRGYAVNHKRVLRLLRQDNLLCLRRRSFLRTTDSEHGYPAFPNVAASLEPAAVNQLWVADITYIRLRREFVYLAVVLDAFSRRVVGWALGRSLEAELALAALRMALAERRPAPGLVHHSDRGVQYACGAYRALLEEHGVRGSMSRRGNPYDNAYAESFMKTLKYEEVRRPGRSAGGDRRVHRAGV